MVVGIEVDLVGSRVQEVRRNWVEVVRNPESQDRALERSPREVGQILAHNVEEEEDSSH